MRNNANKNSNQSFETDRLIIQPTTAQDAEFILELMNTPKWLQFIGDRNVTTTEKAKAYIDQKMTPQLERLGFSNYTVIRKKDNCKIGTCGLYDREGLIGIDIGFAFLPEFEGKGFAFEATNELKNQAFDNFGLTQINAITDKDNISSQRLLEKVGLTLTGTTKVSDDAAELLLYTVHK